MLYNDFSHKSRTNVTRPVEAISYDVLYTQEATPYSSIAAKQNIHKVMEFHHFRVHFIHSCIVTKATNYSARAEQKYYSLKSPRKPELPQTPAFDLLLPQVLYLMGNIISSRAIENEFFFS